MIIEFKSALAHGLFQVRLEPLALAQRLRHGDVEEDRFASPIRLRPVERNVGGFHDLVGRTSVLGRGGDADAGADLYPVS